MDSQFRVSQSVAKLLKEAGFPQDGCDYYYNAGFHGNNMKNGYAAPCVGRLGDELPDLVGEFSWSTNKEVGGEKWVAWFLSSYRKADTEADARGLMWIELKKRGLL